jgi:SAM-dependent methyltransferase
MLPLSSSDRRTISASILRKYEAVSVSPAGQFRYPTGREGLARQGYDPALVDRLPPGAADLFAGVGNPLSLGRLGPGQRVLDIGCGAGVDTLLAALLVGPDGEAVGLEFSPAMLRRAEESRRLGGIWNVRFLEGAAERLPFGEAVFDLVISSGVFNLVVDKDAALAEAFRVLRPGGRAFIADQMLLGPQPAAMADAVATWFT